MHEVCHIIVTQCVLDNSEVRYLSFVRDWVRQRLCSYKPISLTKATCASVSVCLGAVSALLPFLRLVFQLDLPEDTLVISNRVYS